MEDLERQLRKLEIEETNIDRIMRNQNNIVKEMYSKLEEEGVVSELIKMKEEKKLKESKSFFPKKENLSSEIELLIHSENYEEMRKMYL